MSIPGVIVRQRLEGDTTMRMNRVLWIVQGLLALVFLFTGGIKLVLPLDALKGPVALPGLFVRFIGVCEVLGAIGLILPRLLRIRPGLTPLAAAGLAIITTGATVITVMGGSIAGALLPLIVGVLAGFVAYGRWRLVPGIESPRPVRGAATPGSAATPAKA
jgi:DoxX-like protein